MKRSMHKAPWGFLERIQVWTWRKKGGCLEEDSSKIRRKNTNEGKGMSEGGSGWRRGRRQGMWFSGCWWVTAWIIHGRECPQRLAQCLTESRHSVNIYWLSECRQAWMSEWINTWGWKQKGPDLKDLIRKGVWISFWGHPTGAPQKKGFKQEVDIIRFIL